MFILSVVDMGWLRLVGSFKFLVYFVEYRLFCKALLRKRPIILRSLLIIATLCVCADSLSLIRQPLSFSVCINVYIHMRARTHILTQIYQCTHPHVCSYLTHTHTLISQIRSCELCRGTYSITAAQSLTQ